MAEINERVEREEGPQLLLANADGATMATSVRSNECRVDGR